MTLTRIADPESIGRQGKLLAALEHYASEWLARADDERYYGHAQHAPDAGRIAWRCQLFAGRARRNLAAVAAIEQSAPGLADVLAKLPADEPPDSCPLSACESWSKPAPAVEHVVIDEGKGYAIHLFRRTPAVRVGWWARLRGWLAGWGDAMSRGDQ